MKKEDLAKKIESVLNNLDKVSLSNKLKAQIILDELNIVPSVLVKVKEVASKSQRKH